MRCTGSAMASVNCSRSQSASVVSADTKASRLYSPSSRPPEPTPAHSEYPAGVSAVRGGRGSPSSAKPSSRATVEPFLGAIAAGRAVAAAPAFAIRRAACPMVRCRPAAPTGPRPRAAVEQRIALQLGLDIGHQIEIGQLQQLDRLHQLRRHHQRLALADLESLGQCHLTGRPNWSDSCLISAFRSLSLPISAAQVSAARDT